MNATEKKEYESLSPAERKIYDSVKNNFPATSHGTCYDIALQGGIKFQFIPT